MGKIEVLQKPKGPRPVADQELAVGADNRLKLDQLLDDFIRDLPPGGDPSFRNQIDDVMVRLHGIDDLSEANLHKTFSQVRGAISQISAKGGGNLDPEQRRIRDENAAYREHALKIAGEGVRIFSIPTVDKSLPGHFTLNEEINAAFERATLDTGNGMYGFIEFLSARLTDPKQEWNSVNIVTALYKLGDLDPQWSSRPFGQAVGGHLIEKLVTVADKYIFNGHSVCNLAERAPALVDVVNRMFPKNPILEKRLFEALGKAVQYTKEMPDATFADKSFFYPLREIMSCYLSPEGSAALCTYVAKLNHLFSQTSYAHTLGTVAATFHAINGIGSWARNPDSDAKLTVMLKNLNDRLEKSPKSLDSLSAGSIIYGLKGLDVKNLSEAAVEQVTRTMRLVTDKLNALPPGYTLDHRAVSSIVHGLALALEERDGAVARATQGLITALSRRLPNETKTFDELGALCGALVTLRPHVLRHKEITLDLLNTVRAGALFPGPFFPGARSTTVAWQVIQQAFALYQQELPERLGAVIDRIAPSIVNTSIPTRSEMRVKEWARAYPGVAIEKTQFINGFEVDILIKPNINIEVDGVHHKDPAKLITDRLRDAYLSRKPSLGLRIIRVPSNITKEDFERTLSQALEESHSPVRH